MAFLCDPKRKKDKADRTLASAFHLFCLIPAFKGTWLARFRSSSRVKSCRKAPWARWRLGHTINAEHCIMKPVLYPLYSSWTCFTKNPRKEVREIMPPHRLLCLQNEQLSIFIIGHICLICCFFFFFPLNLPALANYEKQELHASWDMLFTPRLGSCAESIILHALHLHHL